MWSDAGAYEGRKSCRPNYEKILNLQLLMSERFLMYCSVAKLNWELKNLLEFFAWWEDGCEACFFLQILKKKHMQIQFETRDLEAFPDGKSNARTEIM